MKPYKSIKFIFMFSLALALYINYNINAQNDIKSANKSIDSNKKNICNIINIIKLNCFYFYIIRFFCQ